MMMRERIRLLLAVCFYYSGLVRLALWWQQRFGRCLIILNYHRAIGMKLRPQLLYLRRHYRVMHLEDALREFYTSSSVRDRRIPLVLTFDDGYLDNYIYGWRLAQMLQVPFTVFLIPGYSESGNCFWWLAGAYLVEHTTVDKVTVEGYTYHLADSAQRRDLVKTIDLHLRYAPSVAEREAFLVDMQRALEVSLPCRATRGDKDTALPLTWAEIRKMEESGWVSFGAHTMHHPVLGYLTDTEEVRREIEVSRHVLEEQLGHSVRLFAYPIGKSEHIGKAGQRLVQSAGYDWAVTTCEDVNTARTNPYLLNRLPGDIEQHWLIMASELVGLLGVVSKLRKKR
jgi:peptidoglycan/xylan/chitin deacetylase (PgdA/CDA1 family)